MVYWLHMLDTKQLLYFVLSISVIWTTFFLCWALYELATLSRRARSIVDEAAQRVTRLEETWEAWKEKLVNPLTYMNALVGGGKGLYSAFQGRKNAKKKSRVDEE